MPSEQSQAQRAERSEDPMQTKYESSTLPSTEKRQRKPQKNRPRSMVDRTRRSGLVALDISGCKNDDEARSCINSYWEPPALNFSRRNPPQRPKTPPPNLPPQELNEGRRHSEPSVSPDSSRVTGSPESTPGQYVLPPRRTPGRAPATPESLPDDIPKGRGLVGSLVNAMERLFTGAGNHELPPSSAKVAEREKKMIRETLEKAKFDRDSRRLKRQSPLKPLVGPLDAKWDTIVSETLYAHRDKTITTSLEGTDLRYKDFITLLGPRAWLNDEIINAYIEWVVVAANEAASAEAKAYGEKPSTVPKFIAHNSFFYTNLKNRGPTSTDRLMKRKKADGVKLLEVDTIFVPICQGSHWTIGVVRPMAKTIEYFDSMGGSSYEFTMQMQGWLKHQLKEAYKDEEWTTPRTGCAEQTNGFDCGVFVCTNAFCVASGIDTSCYKQQDMTLQRRCIAAVLINRGFTKDFQWGKGGLLPIASYLRWGRDGLRGEIERIRQEIRGPSCNSTCGAGNFYSDNQLGGYREQVF